MQLKNIRQNLANSALYPDYEALLLGNIENLSEDKLTRLLSVAIVFLNNLDCNIQRLGYRIILSYSNLTGDYKPLYDIAINKGLYPITAFIEYHTDIGVELNNHFISMFISSFQDNYKCGTIYWSKDQQKLSDFVMNTPNSIAVVAPTSYGKSELMINKIYDNLDKKICIIVPSKALLAQTKKRIVRHNSFSRHVGRIITHPEMYKGDEQKFIAVLTQERLMRLMQKNESLSLDLLFVDEAHNIFDKDYRAQLLSQCIFIANKRNNDLILNFYSPFIVDPNNLTSKYSNYTISAETTSEYIKSEMFYIADLKNTAKLYLYDQFANKPIHIKPIGNYNDITFVLEHQSRKNVIYLNRPCEVERYAKNLAMQSDDIGIDISMQIDAIADFVHPRYNLIACLRKGIIYHHGGVSEIVRLYVEKIYSEISEIKHIVTNSTLLEGVNIPAEQIFIVNNKIGNSYLSKSQFKNLIGRVCRFSEIFNPEKGGLHLLQPKVFLMNGDYTRSGANLLHYIEQVAKIDIEYEDNVDNVLHKETLNSKDETEALELAIEYINNSEPNTISDCHSSISEYDIARLCYVNYVHDFNIRDNEESLEVNLASLRESNICITDSSTLMYAVYMLFIVNIELLDFDFNKLASLGARNYYAMLLNWRIENKTFQYVINKKVQYWKRQDETIVYVGKRWGERSKHEANTPGDYIDISSKTSDELINIAIVRIKEEQDYIDYSLMKYVDIISELGLINESFYSKIKYGTDNPQLITLLKNGFSIELAKLVVGEKFNGLVQINCETDEVVFKSNAIAHINQLDVNDILKFELQFHATNE